MDIANLGVIGRRGRGPRSLLAIVGVAGVVLAACGGGSSSSGGTLPTGPVTMGVLSCFTGSLASLGSAMLQGSQVAQLAINKNGGILGQQLVLSHIVPPIPGRFFYPAFLDGAAKHFAGPIVVGEDGMLFSLPAGSKAIKQSRLF